MVLVNTLSGFRATPAWLKHATVFGEITVTDFVITMFMLAVGVAYELALPRSIARKGRLRTVWRYARRGLVLIGFGVLGSVLLKRDLVGEWGVLQTIGLAGIVALPFMFLRPAYRAVAAIVLILFYQLLGAAGHWQWLVAHDTGHLGGIPGGLAWAGVVLVGSVAGSFVRQSEVRGFRLTCILFAVLGVGLGLLGRHWLPIYKPLATLSYILVTTGLAVAVLLAFSLLDLRFWPFRVFGANALVIFMLHGLLGELAAPKLASAEAPAARVLLVLALVYAVCFAVAGILYRKKILIRL
jgi:predicted acyltransferase